MARRQVNPHRRRFKQPEICRVMREPAYRADEKESRERRANREPWQWLEEAKLHARNLKFSVPHGVLFVTRRHDRRQQAYRLRQIRNCMARYRQAKVLLMKRPHYSEPRVLKSAAGWYVGTLYWTPEPTWKSRGWWSPGSRESGYFETKEDAAEFLAEYF